MAQKCRLKEKYLHEVVPAMMKKNKYRNVMEVPRLVKVVINMGLGFAQQDIKVIENAVEELTTIAGQKAVITRARKSIAAFKIKQGNPIGCMVTLRRSRMYYFLDKLFNISIPRIRDFRGFSTKAFDGRGNYTIGIKEQLIFPEINYDQVDRIKGMNITIVTTAKTDNEAQEMLSLLGLPFR